MGLGFGLLMRLGHAMAFEGEPIAGVGVGEDGLDLANGLPGEPVDRHRAGNTLIADVVSDHPAAPTAIGSPNYGPATFFWT